MEFQEFSTYFDPDEFLFEEGDAGECAYIIESGSVEVSLDKGGKKLVIATLGAGEVLGEMAIIDKFPRTATARAIERTKVTAIPLEYVEQKIDNADPTVRLFLLLIMERYRELLSRLSHVFEGISPFELDAARDVEANTTMELKNVMTQYMAMKKRIITAVNKPVTRSEKISIGETTLQSTKILVIEEKRLKSAFRNEEFRLHYQPIIELASKKIVGCEALVRWQHPSGKLFPPSRFIAKAEDTGLIINLGYWIAEQACSFQKRLSDEFKQPLFVSINLSGKQFDDQLLIPTLANIMDKAGATREQIKFEITETLLVANPELANRSLNELKETGAKLAIDDFGTGYSSFSYLHRFPFDTLKVDRAFVSAMLRNTKSNEIIKTLVNLSHDLGMDVVAEGIETEREADLLGQYNAEYGQGFYFSRAVTEEELIKLL
jgi:EAL domain-containing protein (putative c-di-GMP-specific phosphodiesterase class I)/CRP-like cAMP-binding protein